MVDYSSIHVADNSKQMSLKSPDRRKSRTELSQSKARIIFGSIILAIVAGAAFFGIEYSNQKIVIGIMAAYVAYSIVLFIAINHYPQPVIWRRGLSIILDMVFAGAAILPAGPFGGAFYPLYLWIIVGNGLRFGVPYLIFAMVMGVASFTTVVISSDYWGQHYALAVGLIIGLVLLPMFYVVILRELEATNIDLVKQKEAAVKADIAKSRFLAAASHDLRQPLQAQALFVAELYERLNDPEKSLAIVEKLEDSIEAMREQFNALLDISKLDAGVVRPTFRHFQLSSLLTVLRDEYAQQAEAKGLKFKSNCEDVAVYSDPGLLDSVLRNLVVNAIYHTYAGQVTINCHRSESVVRIEVVDTGPGIEERYLEDIFQEFFQINNPERDREHGLGLGLSVVRRITSLLECPLHVHSTVGKGSTFSIDIPIGSESAVRHEIEVGATNNKRVLDGTYVIVIDDDQAIRQAMKGLLESWGCRVMVAGTGEDVLFKIAESNFKPDIIIMDYRLPGSMNGVQAVTEIRKHCGWETPAILITGDIEIEKLKDVKGSGIPFLHKPIQPGRLRTLMHHLLSGQ